MSTSVPTKQCYLCQLDLPVTEFHRDRATRTGYRSRCKKCSPVRKRTYCAIIQSRLYQQRYYREHREYYAKWRETHREQTRLKARERRLITGGNK